MDEELRWIDRTLVRRPVMVVCFNGWFDAAGAASGAARFLQADGPVVASIDPEQFFDFTATRPEVRLDANDERQIVWPTHELRAVTSDHGHDLVVLCGAEPHIRWRTFARLIASAAAELECPVVVSVGAVPDAVPHTRQPVVFGSSTNEGLARRLGLSRPQYQGVTGVVGVLHDQLDRCSIPAVALRVGVAHYALAMRHPAASLALVQHVAHVTGASIDVRGLQDEATEWRVRHDEALNAADLAVRLHVAALEREFDLRREASLPTPDDLAAQFEAFLFEQRGDDGTA